MGQYGTELVLVAALILANAAFAGSEIALISLREGQLRRLEERGGAGSTLSRLARDPNRFLATVQIGITLAGFLASATAAVTLAEPVERLLGFVGAASRPVSIVLVTAVLVFLTLVIGELAPKRVAMQRAERWGLVVARPLALLAKLTQPAVWLLGHATNVAVRLVGGDPSHRREHVTEDEIRDLVSTHRLYTPGQRRIIAGALDVSDRTVREVLTARPDVVALRAGLPARAALSALAEAGHIRAPVFEDELDDADRVVVVLDLVGADGRVGDHAVEAVWVPETAPVIDALRTLQSARQQMALVASEYGDFAGVVTVEDLVEEVVGEIYDEFDSDVRRVVRHADGSMTLVGGFPYHDLEDLGVDVPPGDYVTVAGLILDRLGYVPERGEAVEAGDWTLVVDEVRDRRIGRVTFHPRVT